MKFAAFTLIELLVAMAVLAIVLVMMLQVTNGILQSTRIQNDQMDAAAGARRALDVIVADLRAVPDGGQSAILVSSGSSNVLAVLTGRRGPGTNTGAHRFLAVRYATNAHRIQRLYGSVDYTATNLVAETANAPVVASPEPLASGILALRIVPVLEPGSGPHTTNNYNGNPVPGGWLALVTHRDSWSSVRDGRVRALDLWIAAADPSGFEILQNSGTLDAATAALQGEIGTWRGAIDSDPGIPSRAKAGVRILNRRVPLQ